MSSFTDDVFISYAHQNNEDGWVDAFHSELLIQLNDLLPREPRIWRDAQISGGDIFSDEIKEKVRTTKLLVSILSPRYINSEWCLEELAVFHKAAEQNAFGLRIKNKSRIIKAVKVHLEYEEHPKELKDTTGFEFFEEEKQTHKRRTFIHRPNGYKYEKFKELIADIASDIAEMLKAIDKQSSATELQKRKPIVFLAETISDLKTSRDDLRNELEARGYQVVPPNDAILPRDKLSDYKNAVNPYLKDAKLSVHLIGKDYGMSPEDSTKSIIELQNEWAAARRDKDTFESLIWIPEDINVQNIEDPRQQEFLNYLLKNEDAQHYAEPSHNNFEAFKQKLVNKLKKLEEIPPDPPRQSNIKKIYVMCDQRDKETVKSVKSFLFNKGFEVFLLPSLNGQGPAATSHEKFLKLCDATLIYYGATDEDWVGLMILDLLNTISLRQSTPFLCKALYLADPQVEYSTHAAEIIKYDGKSIEESLMPFIECLQGNARHNGSTLK